MAKRPIFGASSITEHAAQEWYERMPKWKLAIILQHLAARTTLSYDEAMNDGQWLDVLLQEEAALTKSGCFRGKW